MDSWGFWEWLTYGCIAVAALMLALDAAVKQSPDLNARFGAMLASRVWAFTPFALILVSAIVIAMRHLTSVNSSSSQASRPELTAVPTAPLTDAPTKPMHIEPVKVAKLPDNLSQISNDDLRALTYTVSAEVHALSWEYYGELVAAQGPADKNITGSPEHLAADEMDLDAKFNRVFRAQFQDVLYKLDVELFRRWQHKESPPTLGNGLLTAAQAESVADRINREAKELP